MRIQKVNLSELKPLERNVRVHSEAQIKELVRSVEAFGQTRALVIDEDNNILIGNGLYAALVRMGAGEAFAYRKTGLSEKDKKKLILADNKTFSLGADDFENIEAMLAEITIDGDFDVAGFDEDVLRNLMREAEQVLADVENYGAIGAEDVERKRKAAEIQKREMEARDGVSVSNPSSNTDEGEKSQQGASILEFEPSEVIVCPNCGEVMPLD